MTGEKKKQHTIASIRARSREIVATEKVSIESALQRAAKEAGYPNFLIASNKLRNRR